VVVLRDVVLRSIVGAAFRGVGIVAGTGKHRHADARDAQVFVLFVGGYARLDAAIVFVGEPHVVLLDIRKNRHLPRAVAAIVGIVGGLRRQPSEVVVIAVHGEAELLEVVAAFHAVGRLADFLNRRQKQADQDRDDRNDHQKLNKRKTAPGKKRRRWR